MIGFVRSTLRLRSGSDLPRWLSGVETKGEERIKVLNIIFKRYYDKYGIKIPAAAFEALNKSSGFTEN
jgi:hypothetical protein